MPHVWGGLGEVVSGHRHIAKWVNGEMEIQPLLVSQFSVIQRAKRKRARSKKATNSPTRIFESWKKEEGRRQTRAETKPKTTSTRNEESIEQLAHAPQLQCSPMSVHPASEGCDRASTDLRRKAAATMPAYCLQTLVLRLSNTSKHQ